MNSRRHRICESNDDNLETFELIWLDADANITNDNQWLQQQLRQIINRIKIFDNQQQCHQYILSQSKQDRLVLIVSGQLGRQLVPEIHQLRQISSIYVYCMDKRANEAWTKYYAKVKNVIDNSNHLINQIKYDQRCRNKLEEPLTIKIYNDNTNPDQSTTELNGHYVYLLLIIDILIRIKLNENDKKELISLCKSTYKYNQRQLALVREFEQQYSSDKALWWYTREGFVYQMLNKALRVQNINLLYLFRFLIKDIYRQLKQNQCQRPVTVYRGQLIANDELKILQQSIGKTISITSFFSTSLNYNEALPFLSSANISNDLCRILFVINANPAVVKDTPFANISRFSENKNESEVLFMIGCVFCLKNIHYDDHEQVWRIEMDLCDDDKNEIKRLFNFLKKQYECDQHEVSLRSFGDVLCHMGKYDLAEKIYFCQADQLSANDPSLANLYYSLGVLSKDRNQYDTSLEWFQKSLNIKSSANQFNSIDIGDLYCCIGNIYMEKGNDDLAMTCYNEAINCYNQIGGEDYAHIAAVYHGIARVYLHRKNYSQALDSYKQSLSIQEKYLPSNHFDMATNLDSIGIVYRHRNQYDIAKHYHRRSLEIRLKSLPSRHPDIAMSHKNLGLLYEAKNDWKHASKQFKKAAIIYSQSLSPEHPYVTETQNYLHRVFVQMN